MDIISCICKSVELLFQTLGLIEVWTHGSMELSPFLVSFYEDNMLRFPSSDLKYILSLLECMPR
jgi:hypothetical protein